MTSTEGLTGPWPAAELSPVRRLRVLAAALPGTQLAERFVDAETDEVWDFLSDIERNVPRFDPLVRSLRILRRHAQGLDVVAVTKGVPVPFRVRLERLPDGGLVWMQAPARTYLVATAVSASAGGCQLAHLEGVPRRSRLGHRWLRGHVASDLETLARLVSGRP